MVDVTRAFTETLKEQLHELHTRCEMLRSELTKRQAALDSVAQEAKELEAQRSALTKAVRDSM